VIAKEKLCVEGAVNRKILGVAFASQRSIGSQAQVKIRKEERFI
jgi:hypothetical protein